MRVRLKSYSIQLGHVRLGLTTQQTIVKTRIVYTVEDEIPERGL